MLTDPYYPGWRAYVDGIETPILRADYLFRAARSDRARTTSRSNSRPPRLRSGRSFRWPAVLIVAAGVLVGMVGWLVASLLHRRRRAAPAA